MRTVIKSDLIRICSQYNVAFTSHFYLRCNALRNTPKINLKHINILLRKFMSSYADGISTVKDQQMWKVIDHKQEIAMLLSVEERNPTLVSIRRGGKINEIYQHVNNIIYI